MTRTRVVGIVLVVALLVVSGCSNGASSEERQRLRDLRTDPVTRLVPPGGRIVDRFLPDDCEDRASNREPHLRLWIVHQLSLDDVRAFYDQGAQRLGWKPVRYADDQSPYELTFERMGPEGRDNLTVHVDGPGQRTELSIGVDDRLCDV